MKRMQLTALLLMVLIPLSSLLPCTTFCFKDKRGNIYFGRNFDFSTGIGHVEINLRDQVKSSFIWHGSGEKPFTWISKYGSITFNQNGREMPYGGMNETGLVVEQMWLMSTKYPALDERNGLTELQWIQYQLDMASSVEDVIKSDRAIRVSAESKAPIHFLITDAKGNTAVIEYINGKMNYYTGDKLKYTALANDAYDYSVDYKTNKDNAGSKKFDKDDFNSLDRFYTAASMSASYDGSAKPVDYAFDVLGKVSQPGGTKWSIVYDVKMRKIFYKTEANTQVRELNLSRFDFASTAKKLFIDMDDNNNKPGNFKVFNYEDNFKLIDKAWNSINFLKDAPKEERMALAKFPESVVYNKSK